MRAAVTGLFLTLIVGGTIFICSATDQSLDDNKKVVFAGMGMTLSLGLILRRKEN